ncbi:polymorphic toxin type 44 domain-containing protein [Mycobacteroides abscessus]|uniref:polymorphic toxin type 44 domain-containing protein n=1 Tax=Mycobacteroides abscessus TaxID=36809 RepID=UPI0014041944|nr:polymorphic toxin type 44 domain-containing protein [Mycobacteroides abscessus]
MTIADVLRWNPEAIRGVKAALTKRGATVQEIADALGKLPLFSSWEGASGAAAKESLNKLATYLVAHADEMAALAQALEPAANAVQKVKDELRAVYAKADGWHIEIDPATAAVTPSAAALNASSPSELMLRVAEIQRDVKRVLAMAETVDQGLASAITNGTGTEHLPGSLAFTLEAIVPKPLPPDMHPTSSEQNFTKVEKFMYDEMMKNLKSDEVNRIHELMTPPELWEIWKKDDALVGQMEFARMVQTNGPWDQKPQIQDLVGIHKGDGLFLQQPGTDRQVYYDMWSNLHFGYVGKAAGLDEASLMAVPNIPVPFIGGNDASDNMYVRAGIDMFNKYGPNMTFEQFHQGVGQLIDQLDTAQRSGTQIDQLRHGYK